MHHLRLAFNKPDCLTHPLLHYITRKSTSKAISYIGFFSSPKSPLASSCSVYPLPEFVAVLLMGLCVLAQLCLFRGIRFFWMTTKTMPTTSSQLTIGGKRRNWLIDVCTGTCVLCTTHLTADASPTQAGCIRCYTIGSVLSTVARGKKRQASIWFNMSLVRAGPALSRIEFSFFSVILVR